MALFTIFMEIESPLEKPEDIEAITNVILS
jgi:hypothetical protein